MNTPSYLKLPQKEVYKFKNIIFSINFFSLFCSIPIEGIPDTFDARTVYFYYSYLKENIFIIYKQKNTGLAKL